MTIAMLVAAGIGSAQVASQSRTLVVSGYQGKIPLGQVDGKSCVEVEALARLTNGSVSFQANQTTLTISAAPPTGSQPKDQPAKKAFSPEFLKAGIEAMTTIREWRIAIVQAIQNNYPVTENWVGSYRRAADSKLALATAAATTDDDQNGLPMLNTEFGNMQKLSDKYVALRESLTYIPTDALENDPLDQQILNCARGLTALAGGGQFQDVPSCH